MGVRKNSNILILEIFLWLRALLTLVPATAEFSPMIVNVATVLVVYVLLFTYANSILLRRSFTQFIPLYVITIANALFGYKTSSLVDFVYGLAQWFIWPLAVNYMVNSKKEKALTRLFYISTSLMLLTAVTTYWGNQAFPGASRALAAVWSDDSETAHFYRRLNIGGFEFIYLLVLMIPVWIYIIRTRQSLYQFIYSVASIIIAFAAIVGSEYTTALLFSIGSIILLLLPKYFTSRKLLLYIIVSAVILFFSSTFISSFLSRVVDTTESKVFAERFAGISDYMVGNYVEGDVDTRNVLMLKSWRAFYEHPIMGSSDVGGHSYILDTMGHFGFFGILLLAVVFSCLYNRCVKPQIGTMFYGYLLFVYISQIVLAFLNTQIVFQFFFIIAPIITIVFNQNK